MAIFDFTGVLVAPGDFSTAFNFASVGATLSIDEGDADVFRVENDDDTISVSDISSLEVFVDADGVLRDPVEELEFYSFTDAATNEVLTVMLIIRPNNQYIAVAYDEIDGKILASPIPAGNYAVSGPDDFTDPISLVPDAVNSDPIAGDDNVEVDEDGSLTFDATSNDSDPDGDTVSVLSVGQGASGSVALEDDGRITYRPNDDFNGSDSFTYEVGDGNGGTSSATVSVTVNPVNDDPVAEDDSFEVDEDGNLKGNVLSNDIDIDGDVLTISLISGPEHGGFMLCPDGSFEYFPEQDFTGEDSFVYQISDGIGASSQATVTLTVKPLNDKPVAQDDSYSVKAGNILTISAIAGLLANDTDVDLDALSVTQSDDAGNGTLDIIADGSFTYTPDAGFVGTETISYTITDGVETASATLEINVGNEAPEISSPAIFEIDENTIEVGAVEASDGDGDALVYSIIGGADADFFDIDTSSGALSFKTEPDFETPLDEDANNAYELVVGASDGTTTSTQDTTVKVGDVFDTGPIVILGTPGDDFLIGTDADELFLMDGGSDYVIGDGGTDVFVLGFAEDDGRQQASIRDYMPGEDSIDLNGLTIFATYEAPGSVILIFDNADYDTLLVTGANSFADLSFV